MMNSIFPQRTITYDLRNSNPFKTFNVKGVFNGTETISFRGPKTWLMVPESMKNAVTLHEFKAKIKLWKPHDCTCRICRKYIHNVGFIN